ncbi:MAG: hypothetical protein OXC14_10435 [Rhodospirillaceae bacterium]|nr:hypothetical protein [Rhodospirillaceae bacterium]
MTKKASGHMADENRFRLRIRTEHFHRVDFEIHEFAKTTHGIWEQAVSEFRDYFPDALLKKVALADAMRCSPLPVIDGGQVNKRRCYYVLGGFHIFRQLKAYAKVGAYAPLKATLCIVESSDGGALDAGRLESLVQSLAIVDVCGRGTPIDEMRAVYDANQPDVWNCVKFNRLSRAQLADCIGCTEAQLVKQSRHGKPREGKAGQSDEEEVPTCAL